MKLKLQYLPILIVALGALILFSGCSKDEEPRFSMPVEVIIDLPIEFSTFQTHTQPIFSIPNFINTRLADNGMTADQVTSIVAGRGLLTPVTANVQYQLINDVIINISSVNDDDIQEMYYNEFIEFDHSGNLELFSSISELKEIMLEGVFDLDFKFNLRENLTAPTQHTLRFELLIYD